MTLHPDNPVFNAIITEASSVINYMNNIKMTYGESTLLSETEKLQISYTQALVMAKRSSIFKDFGRYIKAAYEIAEKLRVNYLLINAQYKIQCKDFVQIKKQHEQRLQLISECYHESLLAY